MTTNNLCRCASIRLGYALNVYLKKFPFTFIPKYWHRPMNCRKLDSGKIIVVKT